MVYAVWKNTNHVLTPFIMENKNLVTVATLTLIQLRGNFNIGTVIR